MKYIGNNSTNPYFNLAMEEYVLKYLPQNEEYFILWQNEPSIIIGKHQNTIEEINMGFVKENGINVVRRLSGGGAVYHDLGNVNFTFVINNVKKEILDFKKFTLPVIKALGKLGVEAELSGRNDLTIGGKKFSGNAQYIYKDRLLHHGTLLFDTDLEVLQQALNVDVSKIQSKGIKSVRSRVTNIKEHLGREISIPEFIEVLSKYIFEYQGQDFDQYRLTQDDLEKVNRIMQERYATWEWNYGESPPFNFKNSKRFAAGKVEVLLEVKDGKVNECKIYGDFLGVGDVAEVEEKIKGLRYAEEEIRRILKTMDINKYFGGISGEEILSCFFV